MKILSVHFLQKMEIRKIRKNTEKTAPQLKLHIMIYFQPIQQKLLITCTMIFVKIF